MKENATPAKLGECTPAATRAGKASRSSGVEPRSSVRRRASVNAPAPPTTPGTGAGAGAGLSVRRSLIHDAKTPASRR
jgi:hypothetical protein